MRGAPGLFCIAIFVATGCASSVANNGTCNGDSDCPTGEVCAVNQQCAPSGNVAPCRPACSGGKPVCDAKSLTCVQCLVDADCPGGESGTVCRAHTCQSGCSAAHPGCGPDAGSCDVDLGVCRGCLVDAECTDPASPRCEATSGRCMACLPDHDNCPANRYCTGGAGGYQCVPGCKANGDCPGGSVLCCNHQCTDSAADPTNCGACGTSCGAKTCCGAVCIDTQGDAHNCGHCGVSCAVQNGVGACSGGGCFVGTCTLGYSDCNHSAVDGCEARVGTDPNNCGRCGHACPAAAHAQVSCVGGSCNSKCAGNYADCDGNAATGCESDLNTDLQNCGACGNACPTAPNGTAACVAGVCAFTCTPGYFDCDQNFVNGCEANLAVDTRNCGVCSNSCVGAVNATAACMGGACQLTCRAGYLDCDMKTTNGCEVNGAVDLKNCGACGHACGTVPNGATRCNSGTCGITVCNSGYRDCNSSYADGCEVNLNIDAANCGTCGNVCAVNVPNGFGTCSNGVCGVNTCAQGYADCNHNPADGCEVDLGSDALNCSKCGKVCPAGPNGPGSCSLGICSAAGCPAGKGDCDHVAANGCEVDLTSDVNNCGACGGVCPTVANGVRACSGSVCGVASCSQNFGNCDGNPANGCEASTQTDANNCGGCGHVCPAATPTCQSGTCIGCLARGLSPPQGCFLGADLGSGALYNVCSADCNTAWISADGNGGSYHALQICQTLGYNSLGSFGGTCGSVCSYCGGGSCASPGSEVFDGAGLCGQDAGGPILCVTVMWACIR